MKPISEILPADARALRGLLFDLDDTFLSHGVLTRDAYGSLWDLKAAGLRLVAVTGRPHSWGEFAVRQWPIDGAVTENGALSVKRIGAVLERVDPIDPTERHSRRVRLASLVEEVRAIVPEARLSDDVEGRVSDVTWDIGERVKLPDDRIEMIEEAIQKSGARTFRSSVHLHASYDEADKAKGSFAFLSREFGESEADAFSRYAYIGDSGNDAACFAAFKTTLGVANVQAHLARIPVPPKYVTIGERGAGFREAAAQILLLRAAER